MAARRFPRTPNAEQPSLLGHAVNRGQLGGAPSPLADRLRPRNVDEVVGQEHLLGPGTALARAIEQDRVASMILWGDPGCGKTTLAHVISQSTRAQFVPFSAVLGGVAELRQIVAAAAERKALQGRRTLLFVDEIHRFNRAQQDAFLPHVEDGTIILIGATTENPSFSVNAALLSRAKVFRLEPLGESALVAVLRRGLVDGERGLGALAVEADDSALLMLAKAARGDARRALNQLEAAAEFACREQGKPPQRITPELLSACLDQPALLYDKSGEQHYNVTSAFIKSMRGSDPDAAIYWMMRMLDAGEDPLFVARRLLIFASEDVGNADPRALQVAVHADEAFRRLGMPEGLYPLAHACLYLACCPKSDAVKKAIQVARSAVQQWGALPVPNKLKNAVTPLMKDHGYGDGYRYAHDHAGHFVPDETYLPEQLEGQSFYTPSNEGLEERIAERLARLRGRNPE
jgi:putative ATPase